MGVKNPPKNSPIPMVKQQLVRHIGQERTLQESSTWQAHLLPFQQHIKTQELQLFIVIPMLNPRRDSDDSTVSTDCVIGVTGPSMNPMINRKTNNIANETTNPCMRETAETPTMISAKRTFLLFALSDKYPP